MAFFDIDRRIQILLIAGALATGACGGQVALDGNTDAEEDTYPDWVVDPAPDVIDMADTHMPDPVDPAPDVIDPPLDASFCPDPSEWSTRVNLEGSAWPSATLRATINVPPEFVHLSEPTFTVEKKSVEATRVNDTEYELTYTWSGPLEHDWWDYDLLDVSWRVLCTDEAGDHERVLTQQRIICVDGYGVWMGWGDDPDTACMVVDCVPDSMGAVEKDADAAKPVMQRGVLRTKLTRSPTGDGAFLLVVQPSGPAAGEAAHSWSASGGDLEFDGGMAHWRPPEEPGVYTIQVTTTAGSALSVDVFRFVVEE